MSREFDELLSAYLDGECSPEERAAVERRLEQSPALRETLDELSEVGDLIRRLPRARAPIDLPERVVAAIAPRPLASTAQPRKRHRLFGAWPLFATGTVLAAGVAIVMLLPRQPQNADGFALNMPRPGSEPAWISGSGVRPFAVDGDGSTRMALEVEAAGTRFSFGANPEAVATLSDHLRRLGRNPNPGEVYKTLRDNAGRTQVVQYTVVDTQQVANKLRTILINNSMNVIETETPLPQGGATVASDQAGRLVYYMEAPPEQIGQTLDEFESLGGVREITDFGVLADNTSEAVSAEVFADDAAKPASQFGLRSQDDQSGEQAVAVPQTSRFAAPKLAAESAPAAAPAEADRAAAPLAPAAIATREAAELKRQASSQLGDPLDAEAKPGKVLEPAAPATAARPEAQTSPALPGLGTSLSEGVSRSSTTASAQAANDAYVGVSAQLDSNAPIVQDVLRSRAAGNALYSNSLQGNAVQAKSFQRSSVGQQQSRSYLFRGVRSPQEQLGRRLTESAANKQEKWTDANGVMLKELPAGTAGRAVADSPGGLNAAAIANPQNAPSQAHLLLIIESQAPAAPPVVTDPASPSKKAGD